MTTPVRYRKDSQGKRRKVVVCEGHDGFIETWVDSCSGCTEHGEYGGNPLGLPTDSKWKCLIGMGCDECGYTGKRRGSMWFAFDMGAWMRHVEQKEAS